MLVWRHSFVDWVLTISMRTVLEHRQTLPALVAVRILHHSFCARSFVFCFSSHLNVALLHLAHCCRTGLEDCEMVAPSPIPPTPAPFIFPTAAPTLSRLGLLADILLPETPLSLLSTASKEYAALQWIAEADPMALPAVDTLELRERFALGLLYFSANGSLWFFNSGWMFGSNHCLWAYIFCNVNGSIRSVDLTANGVSGILPTQLRYLENLEGLRFGNNEISGTIPSELGLLTSLTSLQLWTNLLKGSIPTEIGLLTGLTSLALSQNVLSGPIPSQFGNLSMLNFLQIYDNLLDFTIPTDIGQLTLLTDFGIKSNLLDGTLPTEYGELTLMTNLQVWQNKLVGSIPTEFGLLTRLTSLGISTNLFSGELPSELGNLTLLTIASFFSNDFTGSVPSELSLLSNLQSAYFHDTQLNSGLETLFCGYNLVDFWADCLGLGADLECECCSKCFLCVRGSSVLCFHGGLTKVFHLRLHLVRKSPVLLFLGLRLRVRVE